MRDFMKPDATVMNRVIYYSIELRNIRLALLHLRTTKLLLRGLRLQTLTFNELNDNELILIRAMGEIQNSCRLLLEPLFEGINFGHKHLDHWALSMPDIKKGFAELEEIIQYKDNKPLIFGRKYIILVYDYIDPIFGKFYAGEMIALTIAIHFIDNIPEQKDKLKGLYDTMMSSMQIALKYRTSLMP